MKHIDASSKLKVNLALAELTALSSAHSFAMYGKMSLSQKQTYSLNYKIIVLCIGYFENLKCEKKNFS